MPMPMTSQARSRRRWPLGRIAAVFALAGAVTVFTATPVLAATVAGQNPSPDQISSVNVPKSVSEHAIAGAPAATSVAAATTDGCRATVSNITRETLNGEAVVTFTGQVECNSNAAQIYVHTNIFTCGNVQPKESHKFLLANCGNETNAETYTPEESGVTYTISGETAAANGYFASVLSFNIDGAASGPVFGTPVYCSNGSCTNVTYAS